MNAFLTKALLNWKSTLSGILTATLSLTVALLPLHVLSPREVVWAGTIQAVAKVLLGLIQNDGTSAPPTPPSA